MGDKGRKDKNKAQKQKMAKKQLKVKRKFDKHLRRTP